MQWRNTLAALLVALALAGCTQGTAGQTRTGTAYAPYAPENNGGGWGWHVADWGDRSGFRWPSYGKGRRKPFRLRQP